jgi:hypothetical protein
MMNENAPMTTSTITNTKRIKWAKDDLLKALRKQDWGLANMHAEDIAKYADRLAQGFEDPKTIELKEPVDAL